MAKALRANSGQPVLAAAALGVSRQAVAERIQHSTILQGVIADIDERLLSKSVDNIEKAIDKGDAQTSRWLLERRGRHLGYGTKVETIIDTAQLEKIAEAIAKGGAVTIRAVQAALAG